MRHAAFMNLPQTRYGCGAIKILRELTSSYLLTLMFQVTTRTRTPYSLLFYAVGYWLIFKRVAVSKTSSTSRMVSAKQVLSFVKCFVSRSEQYIRAGLSVQLHCWYEVLSYSLRGEPVATNCHSLFPSYISEQAGLSSVAPRSWEFV
jgi:hypothetical protein